MRKIIGEYIIINFDDSWVLFFRAKPNIFLSHVPPSNKSDAVVEAGVWSSKNTYCAVQTTRKHWFFK